MTFASRSGVAVSKPLNLVCIISLSFKDLVKLEIVELGIIHNFTKLVSISKYINAK